MLRDRLGISERRACRYVGQHRSTQRREPVVAGDDHALRAELRELSRDRPRRGYRWAHHELRQRGWHVNRKRVQRLWRQEGLRVPPRARKRRREGDSAADAAALRAEGPDHVWAIDFQHDMTTCGRPIRLCNVIDEHTRQALIMDVDRSQTADQVVRHLDKVVAVRGRAPTFLRSDNGTELTAHALRDWCRFSGTGTVFIEPGCPWQNPFVESFHARVRDELLNVEQFACLAEARVVIGDWHADYNTRRPHSALGMLAPDAYHAACAAA